MPSFSQIELSQLRMLALSQRGINLNGYDLKNTIWSKLIDLSIVWPPNNEGWLEITEHGKRLLAFYDAVKAGKIKKMESQCSGCQNPCQ